MQFSLAAATPKGVVFQEVDQWLTGLGLGVSHQYATRPWGGFFVMDESQTAAFAAEFFPHLPADALTGFARLSPKILVVAPGQRLSWQYHHRRAEVWRVVAGQVAVARSDDDSENPAQPFHPGDRIELRQGERHRLIGLDGYGIVAEIWQHTDAERPSDEDDIVRLQDDFGRH